VVACLRLVLGGFVLTALVGCLAKDSGRPVGEQCSGDGECRSGLHCQYGRCRQACTFDRDCGAGAVCVPSVNNPSIYVCTLSDEGGGSACPEGLADDGTGMCRRPCEPDGPEPNSVCGPAQRCDQGWCVAAQITDGGAPGGQDASTEGGVGQDAGPADGAFVSESGVVETDAGAGGVDSGIDAALSPDSVDWVLIPGGSFQMGSLAGGAHEQPVHTVSVPDFEMSMTEVTVAQYGECVAEGACSEPGTSVTGNWNSPGFEDHPVNFVDWHQAATYCRWAGARLPSEAEWEYAARSGGQDIAYPWGDEPATCAYAVMEESFFQHGCGTRQTWAVCSKPSGNTDHGLCDMAGNTWEWVQDSYHTDYNGAPADGSAWEGGGSDRVYRGGSLRSDASNLRATHRPGQGPSFRAVTLSFRCARD
jgi:formylglycine-generating enzyme required for sulfatase activity